jgi:hypothetical protein
MHVGHAMLAGFPQPGVLQIDVKEPSDIVKVVKRLLIIIVGFKNPKKTKQLFSNLIFTYSTVAFSPTTLFIKTLKFYSTRFLWLSRLSVYGLENSTHRAVEQREQHNLSSLLVALYQLLTFDAHAGQSRISKHP